MNSSFSPVPKNLHSYFLLHNICTTNKICGMLLVTNVKQFKLLFFLKNSGTSCIKYILCGYKQHATDFVSRA